MSVLDAETADWLAAARRLEKYPLARLISLVESDGDAARTRRAALFATLANDGSPRGHVIGLTGTPGAGKSTLIGRVGLELLQSDAAVRLAILAIDPTSHVSGGALLGDRVRTHFPVGEERVFFRSQATQGDLGGMGRRTFHVTRLLRHLFDLVFIETVGVGQSEIEVSQLADVTLLVMQPLAGDVVQFMKAGVMEIPDAFVINKCDEERLARRSQHDLRAALNLARGDAAGPCPILQTSALSGRGVPELVHYLREATNAAPAADRLYAKDTHFLRKTIAERFGSFGLEIAAPWLQDAAGRDAYEAREQSALAAIAARIGAR